MFQKFRALSPKTRKVLVSSATLLTVLAAVLGLVTFAFFSTRAYVRTEDGTEILRTGMKLSTFFDRINSDQTRPRIANGTSLGIECTDESITTGVVTVGDKTYYAYDSSADWGSANNPFIISELKHFENLTVLQNVGYFDVITSAFDQGGTPCQCMPYFLVCEPDGTCVCIDGTEMDHAYEPIGNDNYPFIGYLGGAFNGGTVTVGGKSCDQSVLYNLKIEPKRDYVDIGLFGNIGYLGDDSGEGDSFRGAASVVSDLLLYDIQITVEEPDVWTKITDAIGHTFGFLEDPSDDRIPHENHHIGILAGHVEYATLQYVSVYYSDESIVALDVTHVTPDTNNEKANYMSNTGIIGFVHEMNSTSANGFISKDGTTNADLTISAGGIGTGGGLLSGTGRGYVTAYEVFDQYNDAGNVAHYIVNDVDCYSLLVIASGAHGGTNTFSLQDGTPVSVTTDSSNRPIARITSQYQQWIFAREEYNDWYDFVVRYGSEGNYTYYHKNQTEINAGELEEDSGIYLRFAAQYNSEDSTYKKLCTQYVRNRAIGGGTQTTDRYYFYDGIFTFSLSSNDDKSRDTWTDNEHPDNFTLGATGTNNWKANPSEGQHSIAAYVKQVTNTAELQNAAADGKPLFIMYRNGDSNYLVTLAEQSRYEQGDRDDSLFTSWTMLNWMDDEAVSSLGTAFTDGAISTSQISGALASADPASMTNYWDPDNDEYRLLDVGSSTTELSLDDLRTHYNVEATFTQNTSETVYYQDDGETPFTDGEVVIGNGINETLYSHITGGFFYWDYDDGGKLNSNANSRFKYYYVNPNGSVTTLTNSTQTTTPEAYFTNPTVTNGVRIYTKNGRTGPVVLKLNNQYYTAWAYNNKDSQLLLWYYGSVTGTNQATVNGGTIDYPYTVSHNFFLAKVTDEGTKYLFNGIVEMPEPSEDVVGEGDNAVVQTDTINGHAYTKYKSGTFTGIKLIIYDVAGYYTFGNSLNGDYFMRILSRNYWGTTVHSLMCSTDAYAANGANFRYGGFLNPSVNDSKLATVTFDGDGIATIAYSIGGTTRYLAYYDAYFHGTTRADNSTKLYIYTVEGTQDVSYGRTTFDPINSADRIDLSAASYVLWPDNLKDADTSYTVKQLEQNTAGIPVTVTNTDRDLLKKSQGWKANDGSYLTSDYLSKKFSMESGMSSVTVYEYGNSSFSLDNGDYVRAPIGSEGKEAYIPTGCVAFRVNKSGENQKIRVIVAVPQTELYYQERDTGENSYTHENGGQLDYQNDYFFGMWKISEAGSGTQTISLQGVDTYFYLPRSAKYAPGTLPSEANPSAITVSYNGTEHLCYLNGNKVLVAYEFSCSDEGVYLLGSNLECDIVYFSADATASADSDGEASYKMGTIDYVYSNASQVLTVRDVDTRDKTADGYAKDPASYYYNSYALLYTNNAREPYFINNTEDADVTGNFPNINNFRVNVQRLLTDGSPKIKWFASKDDHPYVAFEGYSFSSDALENVNPNP